MIKYIKNKKIITTLFSLFFLNIIFVNAYADDSKSAQSLISQINRVDNEIRRLATREYKDYKAVKSILDRYTSLPNSYYEELLEITRNYLSKVEEYKPEDVKWYQFKPLEYHEIKIEDADELAAFLDFAKEIRNEIRYINEDLRSLKREIENQVARYNNTSRRTIYYYPAQTTYRRYYYDYPHNSYYQRPGLSIGVGGGKKNKPYFYFGVGSPRKYHHHPYRHHHYRNHHYKKSKSGASFHFRIK